MTPTNLRVLVESLSTPMRAALDRYAMSYCWADGRSTRALVRRGLVIAVCRDPEMFGDTVLHTITPLGRQARALVGEGK
jgi:hypothetical protein